MRFGTMPEFDDKSGLVVKDKSQMTAEKCSELS
jgi:hypothetical protein